MSEANDNYSRRVDDLIDIVQKTIRDVDDFVKGRVKVEPHEYQRVKNTLISRQNAALAAMNKALDGQRELLDNMDKTKQPIPQRRATDRPVTEEELFDIKLRAGIR